MKVYLDTVGCRLNQSEIESQARQFRAAGHILVESAELADLVVLNTCAVTEAAVSDSRQKARQAARAGVGEVVLTGCWATLDPAGAASLPKVKRVVPNAHKDQIVAQILGVPMESFDLEFIEREPVPGVRLRTRAFIKVQDGCDNRCTFCVTTLARGPGRSRTIADILEDVHAAIAGGAEEAVLTGVHLGSWGRDFPEPQGLSVLVKVLLAETELSRLRLSSLEPWDLEEDFFDLWGNPRLCRHLHLPLQSGCIATLHRMARKTTPKDFAKLVEAARSAIPEVAITTDIIVGFPGESQAEFEESLSFVEAMDFAGGHVFTYSPRPGTAAARMPHQVPHALRKARNARMRGCFDRQAKAYRERFLGRALPVLWESAREYGPRGWKVSGLTDNYLRVSSQAPRQVWNQITPVLLTEVTQDGLFGIIQA